jgi:hypothetical protein
MNRLLSILLTMLSLAVCGLLLSVTTTRTVGAVPGVASSLPLSVPYAPGVPPTPAPVQVQVVNTSVPVTVGNFPSTQSVNITNPSLPVTVGNFPSSQTVNGTVSVGNFPSTQNVQVSNTTDNPVPVLARDADRPEWHAFSMQRITDYAWGVPVMEMPLDNVPEGKRFIIESVSLRANVDYGQHAAFSLRLNNNFAKVYHLKAYDEGLEEGLLQQVYVAQESVRLYADHVTSGASVVATVSDLTGVSTPLSLQVYISGYLIDLP